MQLCKIVVTRRLSDGCAKGLGNTPREVASVAADSGADSGADGEADGEAEKTNTFNLYITI